MSEGEGEGNGERAEYVVTYLEMAERPTAPIPHMPAGPLSALIAADRPPAWYFLCLYDAVGAAYHWTDQHARGPDELEALLQHPQVKLCTLMRAGWPQGFYILDWREAGSCDLAYFGLVPQALGQGLGRFLLMNAVHAGWDHAGVERMTVNTNTLDHPRALPLYQRAGFVPVRRETHSRVLSGRAPD